jgi:CheY-like chemotaxis protein
VEPTAIPNPLESSPPLVPESSGPTGILLSRDLIFTAKVTGTARELGKRVMVAGNLALATAMIAQWRPRVVLVDLAAGDLVAPPALTAFRQQTGSRTAFVAFGSHVDTQALADAKAAGCDEVMPRSKFSAELPALIRRYLDGD